MDNNFVQSVDRDIGLFVAIIRELLSQGLVEEVCDDQITVGQIRCLCFIWAHEKATMGDVARGMGISFPAATKLISRLVEKGLVARNHDPRDRRSIYIEITPLGRELTTRVKPEKIRRLGSLLDKIAPEDVESLRRGIEAFLTVAVTDDELFQQICLHCGKEHAEDCVLANIKCRKFAEI
ncbi:MAG TPA: MarR family transcriptional regulator [Desulfobacteria bacterium]|nr:MarR family transcriptional regulator [Desulfobacteria bacterium]